MSENLIDKDSFSFVEGVNKKISDNTTIRQDHIFNKLGLMSIDGFVRSSAPVTPSQTVNGKNINADGTFVDDADSFYREYAVTTDTMLQISYAYSNVADIDGKFIADNGEEYLIPKGNGWNDDPIIFCSPSDGTLYVNGYTPKHSSIAVTTIGMKFELTKDGLFIPSSTPGSSKVFAISVDDSGTISATEI